MIRQFAVPHNGVVQVPVPDEYNEQEVEVQVILTVKNTSGERSPASPDKGDLRHLVGKYKHYSPEQNEKIDRELRDLRDSWERTIS